jgi:hypothetical protein
MSGTIYTGSAPKDAPDNRGWLLGHFMPADDIRHSSDVEVKWGARTRGDRRAEWVTGETRTAVIVLVSGRFRIDFPEQSVVLAERGDYVVFKGVGHSWFAEEESVIGGLGGRHCRVMRFRIRWTRSADNRATRLLPVVIGHQVPSTTIVAVTAS